MKLIIVRHGETFENIKGIFQGHLNSQLTPNGLEQSKNIAEKLKNIKIDCAYSSDLDRALDTCKEILKFHPETNLIPTKILREQSKGVLEGKIKLKKSNLEIPNYNFKPRSGESLSEVWDKVIPFLEKIKNEYKNKTLLIVSHRGPISCLLTHLNNETLENQKKYLPSGNTAISTININNKKIVFETLNCCQHLD